jgi:predicted RNA-binding Zn ribbon-like protein
MDEDRAISTGLPSRVEMRPSSVESQRLVGGVLCLDFANSVDWAADGTERPFHAERLREPADLARWGLRLGVLDPGSRASVTGRELEEARDLRLAVHRTFSAIAAGDVPDAASVALLGRTHADATASGALTAGDGRWHLGWPADEPRRIRFAVAESAVDLLRDGKRLDRVRICPGGNCGWLFVDTSGRRRWCSMEVCGSRAKMRALYERKRREQIPS